MDGFDQFEATIIMHLQIAITECAFLFNFALLIIIVLWMKIVRYKLIVTNTNGTSISNVNRSRVVTEGKASVSHYHIIFFLSEWLCARETWCQSNVCLLKPLVVFASLTVFFSGNSVQLNHMIQLTLYCLPLSYRPWRSSVVLAPWKHITALVWTSINYSNWTEVNSSVPMTHITFHNLSPKSNETVNETPYENTPWWNHKKIPW